MRVVELVPGDNGSEVDEVCDVEKHIQRVDECLVRLCPHEPAVPDERRPCAERRQQVVDAQYRGDAGAEEGHRDGEEHRRLVVDEGVAFRQPHPPAGDVADRCAQQTAEQTLVQDGDADEVFRYLRAIAGVHDDVERQIDEGDCQSVVARRLCCQQVLHVCRHPFRGEPAFPDDGLRQHGVRGRHARRDQQAPCERVARNEQIHERSKHQPADHHGEQEQQEHRPPAVVQMPRRELDSDRHKLDAEQGPRYLERVVERVPPVQRVEPVQTVGAHNESENGRNRCLAEEELLLHQGGAQSEEKREKS